MPDMAKSDEKKTPGADPVKVNPPTPPATDHPIEPKLTAEQQADVARLAGSIAETEKPPLDPAAAPVVEVDQVSESEYQTDAAMCVDMFVELSIDYCAEVAPLWPDDKRKKIASTLGAVFKKYNFTFARFGPELAFAVAAGPVLWQTSKVIALQMNKAAAQPVQARAQVPHDGDQQKAA
jgi:hypothetical protein